MAKEYFDKSLGAVVKSERHREQLMKEKGLADFRDFNSKESLEREAARNRAYEREKRDAYMDKPIEDALARAADGLPFEEELERDLLEGRAKQEAVEERKREAEMDRAREDEERRRWEASRQ